MRPARRSLRASHLHGPLRAPLLPTPAPHCGRLPAPGSPSLHSVVCFTILTEEGKRQRRLGGARGALRRPRGGCRGGGAGSPIPTPPLLVSEADGGAEPHPRGSLPTRSSLCIQVGQADDGAGDEGTGASPRPQLRAVSLPGPSTSCSGTAAPTHSPLPRPLSPSLPRAPQLMLRRRGLPCPQGAAPWIPTRRWHG